MVFVILIIFLPFVVIISSILVFNIYLRKQITKILSQKSIIDQAYLEAEQTKGDDEDLGSPFVKVKEK
jgi:hypothetical protein